ncbi:MAG: (Fe-S)-binding protein [Gemmatimonadaceae bacterium]
MSAAAPPALCAIPGTPLAEHAAGLDACVHCGFCLQSCPTYLAAGDENDSPRGRLVLMRALLEGDLSLAEPALNTHIDRCLGCRGCESACPSGVPYGELLEATRATLGAARPMQFVARLVLAVFARRRLLRAALALARAVRALGIAHLAARLPGRLGFTAAMLAASKAALPARRDGARPYPTASRERATVASLSGCVMQGLFTATNRATDRVLAANGYRIVAVPNQQCCGALHAHAGDLHGARRLARHNIAAFELRSPDFIAVNAAGCGAMLKEYGRLLAGDTEWHERACRIAERTRDVTELLAAAGPARAGPLSLRVAYDPPCHLLHAQRISEQPLAALGAVPGLRLVPHAEAEQCCGAAGIYNLLEPELSARVLDAKLDRLAAADIDVVATGNPGCLMQIGAGLLRRRSRVKVAHPVDLLDAAYAAATDSPSASYPVAPADRAT